MPHVLSEHNFYGVTSKIQFKIIIKKRSKNSRNLHSV